MTMRFISRINSGSGTASLSINDSELLDITIPSIQTVSSNVRSYTKAIPGTTHPRYGRDQKVRKIT